MRYTPRAGRAPRLLVEKADGVPQKKIGFLYLSTPVRKVELGDVESLQFRVIQCLFSPHNFPSAKYEPVLQTYERVFSAIQVKKQTLHARFEDRDPADEEEMTAIVEKTLEEVQKGIIREYFAFDYGEGKVRMQVVAPTLETI